VFEKVSRKINYVVRVRGREKFLSGPLFHEILKIFLLPTYLCLCVAGEREKKNVLTLLSYSSSTVLLSPGLENYVSTYLFVVFVLL